MPGRIPLPSGPVPRSRISLPSGSPAFSYSKPTKVRAIWVRAAGSYGRNDAGDSAMDAAVMSQALGATVRVQYMRAEGTGWDPKGPASIHRARAGLDANGKVVGYRFDSRGFSRTDIATTESDPAHSLAGQSMGMKLSPTQEFGIPTEPYQFPAQFPAHGRPSQRCSTAPLAPAQFASARSRRAVPGFALGTLPPTNSPTPPGPMPSPSAWRICKTPVPSRRSAPALPASGGRPASPEATASPTLSSLAADSPTPSAARPSWRSRLRSKSTAPLVVPVRAAGRSRMIAAW